MANGIHNFGKGNNSGSNAGGGANGTPIGAMPTGGSSFPPQKPTTPEVLENYNEKAKNGDFHEALFRDTQIIQLMSVLTTAMHPNALLTGAAGVGKTQIVEEVARRLATNDPITTAILGGYTIYELQVSKLVAGKSYVGQLEEALHEVIEFASDPKEKAILFIDEIHQLMSSSDPTSEKIAQILKPALGRKDLHVIGATTTQEATTFLKDPAFSRRWSTVIVPELSPAETVEIIKNLKPALEKHHNVAIPDKILDQIITLGDQHKQYGSHRPDTSLSLIDRAMSDENINFEKLKEEAKNDPIIKQYVSSVKMPVLSITQVKKSAMSLITGSETAFDSSADELRTTFNETIIGQDEAKEKIINSIERMNLKLTRRTKPVSFLFVGATGTGKTEITEQLAKTIFGSKRRMIEINLTEYSDSSALTRITGSSDGYVGSTSKRELPFDSLEANPYQVILLDEFEKGSKAVQRFFMQALDKGRVMTNRNKEIDFTRTIIIATTNAGMAKLNEKQVGFGNNNKTLASVASASDINKALEQSFDTELLNRFEHIITFKPMTKEQYTQILAVKYNQIVKEATESRHDLDLNPKAINLEDATSYDVLNKLADESYLPEFNGRPASKTINKYIEDFILDNASLTKLDLL